MSNRIEVLKQTQDDWYPSYRLHGWFHGQEDVMLVRVTFHGNITAHYDSPRAPVYRTSVWGADDCGMEFDSESEATCFNTFLQVIGLKYVNRDELKKLGFVSA